MQAIDPEAHDRLMATVSHLPHVVANVLVGQAAAELTRDSERMPEVGPSFRDTTRVAGANPAIWGDIFASNREAVAEAVDAVAGRLRDAAELIREGEREAVAEWHAAAAADRRRLLEAELAGGPLRELRVVVTNRPGTIAELALALGEAGVNIEDMALYPAPDMTSGAVSLWVVGDDQAARAVALVRELGHTASAVARRRVGVATRFDPAGPLRGSLRPPPDKSISHRAALIAAMGEGETTIEGYLDAADTRSTLAAVQALGAEVEGVGSAGVEPRIRIRGVGLRGAEPGADRRRQRRHAAAAAARLAGRAARGRLDARRRRLDPAPAGRPDRRAAGPDGRQAELPRGPPAAAGDRGRAR